MAFYADVLEHLGKSPREFGSHHVAADPIAVADGQGWAVLWFQAAHAPCDPKATFEVRTSGHLLARGEVPQLPDGAVARGLVRFALTEELTEVGICVISRLDEDAARCRQAWKLFDTRALPELLLTPVDFVRATPKLLEGFSIFWRPGEPLPEPERAPPPVPPPQREPITGYRECVKCTFSGKWRDFKDDDQCPQCGYWW
jgi:hypothetical protein